MSPSSLRRWIFGKESPCRISLNYLNGPVRFILKSHDNWKCFRRRNKNESSELLPRRFAAGRDSVAGDGCFRLRHAEAQQGEISIIAFDGRNRESPLCGGCRMASATKPISKAGVGTRSGTDWFFPADFREGSRQLLRAVHARKFRVAVATRSRRWRHKSLLAR